MPHILAKSEDLALATVRATDAGAKLHQRIDDGDYTGAQLIEANGLLEDLENALDGAESSVKAATQAITSFLE